MSINPESMEGGNKYSLQDPEVIERPGLTLDGESPQQLSNDHSQDWKNFFQGRRIQDLATVLGNRTIRKFVVFAENHNIPPELLPSYLLERYALGDSFNTFRPEIHVSAESIAKAFAVWEFPGRSSAEHRKMKRRKRLDDEVTSANPDNGGLLLGEIAGLTNIYAFLYEGRLFSPLPFVLDISTKKTNLRQNATLLRHQFYMGGSNKYLSFSIPPSILENSQQIYAYPKMLNVGRTPYYLIDLYDKPKTVERSKPFSSARLNPHSLLHKINFISWHGISEQLVADCINGENGIEFDDLGSFDVYVENKAMFISYRLAGEPNLIINLVENSKIQAGDTLRFIPKQDKRKIYQCLDVVKVIEGAQEREYPMISSYRISLQENTIRSQGWDSIEKQLLTEFMTSQNNVQFSDVKPIYFTANEDNSITLTRVNGRQIAYYYPEGTFAKGEEGVFIPKQDETESYQWLELYKTDPTTHLPKGSLINTGRIFDGKVDTQKWSGPEKQLLIDHLENNTPFSSLKDISLTVGNTEVLTIFRRGKNKVYIVLSRSFNLQEGDKIVLSPESESEPYLYFTLLHEGQFLERYRFDLINRTFRTERMGYKQAGRPNRNQEQDGSINNISPEQVTEYFEKLLGE